jgi:hypothetical protein
MSNPKEKEIKERRNITEQAYKVGSCQDNISIGQELKAN